MFFSVSWKYSFFVRLILKKKNFTRFINTVFVLYMVPPIVRCKGLLLYEGFYLLLIEKIVLLKQLRETIDSFSSRIF